VSLSGISVIGWEVDVCFDSKVSSAAAVVLAADDLGVEEASDAGMAAVVWANASTPIGDVLEGPSADVVNSSGTEIVELPRGISVDIGFVTAAFVVTSSTDSAVVCAGGFSLAGVWLFPD